ncbi:MAG: hypothetical protein PF439_11705 [Helicobacteraceae bacterium]|jgi:uncharacterized membrane protein|nr:hypothetical protein [Helicobacteraceae bacterium]
MDLPIISLPVQVPELMPLLLHPVAVHFAVVLPLVILILELINLVTKRKALTVTVYLLFALLLAVLTATYMTGVTDGKEAGPLLSDEGMAALKSHKLIGIYLIYLALVPIVLKAVTLFVKKPWVRIIYLLSFIGVISLTVFQAKEGGELVYNYGANVSSQQALQDRVETLEDEMEELKAGYEENLTLTNAALTDCHQSNMKTDDKVLVTVDENSSNTKAVKSDLTNISIQQELNSSKTATKPMTSDANISK